MMLRLKLYLVILVLLLSNEPIQSLVGARGFTIDLIHHDSPLSPFYNQSLTPSQLLRKAALRSKARFEFFNSMVADDDKAVVSTVYPNRGDYLMKVSVGSPPVQFLAIADTGSDLIWVRCGSCQDCFNPSGSSTYSQVSCTSGSCQALPTSFRDCSTDNLCMYDYRYGGGRTLGVLSSETISLDSTTGQAVAFPASVFGCSSQGGGDVVSAVGLVGLGGGSLSLISQLGNQIDHRFSYCLVPFSSGSTSKLKFGPDAILTGSGVVSTPLVTKSNPTFYFLTLESIRIGEKTTQTSQELGNIVIDSGTTLTYLPSTLYNELEAIVKEAVTAQPVADPTGSSNLCYGGNVEVPDMVFRFTGADLRLTGLNTFRNIGDDVVCMTIVPSDNGVALFGNIAQINFEVEYDIQGKKLSFAPADCTQK